MVPIPVVLTTDCGTEMDDQWALAHLALSPAIELRGIVTTHAPNLAAPAAEAALASVREVLDHLPAADRPPALAGSSAPLVDARTPRPNAGVDLIVAASRGFSPERRLVVLAIGAATDVASALLLDPSLVERIEVVAMGFDGWPAGGDGWNVRNDVAAWQALLASNVPLTVGAADVCIRRLTRTVAQAVALLGDGPSAAYLVGEFRDWLAKPENSQMAGQVTGDPAAWPVWDEVVVGHLLGMTTVVTYPRPVLRDDITFEHSGRPDGGRATISWLVDVDGEAIWQDLAGVLASSVT